VRSERGALHPADLGVDIAPVKPLSARIGRTSMALPGREKRKAAMGAALKSMIGGSQ
jgi:hypothetical protein